MAAPKPKAAGVVLLPKARFPQAENRWPVKPARPADPRADQVLGKYA
jgi:hypothetical protein